MKGAQPFHFLQEMQEHLVPLQKENSPVGGGGLGRPDEKRQLWVQGCDSTMEPSQWVLASQRDLKTLGVWMAAARRVSVHPRVESPRPSRGAQLSESNTGAMWALRVRGTHLSSL